MSDRRDRDRKGRGSRSPSRSRSRSNHKKKSQKQKHRKNKRYNRSYSRSSSYSRSRSRSLSGSPSPKKDYSQKYAKKTDKVEKIEKVEKIDPYHTEKQATPVLVQAPGYQPSQEESSCLIITGLTEETTQEDLEDLLRDIAISLQTSPPDSIQLVSVFQTAYAVFPSVDAAKKILLTMRGKIDNGKVNLELEYYPTGLSGQRSAAPSKDVSLVQDWICDKCEYKNFAKRTKCHKCENPRNNNCKIVYNSPCYIKQQNAPQSSAFPHGKTPNTQENSGSNNSVMVRGAVLQEISETTLLDYFNQYAPVKDIRMVRNKTTGKYRDFAFIEFFTVEEAERVLKASQEQEFRIVGQPVTVAFSRTKKREDDSNYGTDEVSPHPTYQQKNHQYYGSYNSSDVNYMNASTDANSNYYAQNYYNQLNQYAQQYTDPYNTTGTTAANMQQYMQNYGQGYNYNQAYAQGYGSQNYAGYGNYGYDANSQTYARQAYTQQLQQQLQPSTIQQTVQQAQAKPQTQQQQLQVQLPLLSTAATSTPLYQTMPVQTQPEKKAEPLVSLPKATEQEKTQENTEEKETTEAKEKMQVEEKKPEKSEDTASKNETPMQEEKEERKEDNTKETEQKEDAKTEKSKSSTSAKMSKVDEEKVKRKKIEIEMKKWEREQQMKAMMGPGQEEQESQVQQPQQPKKVEAKPVPALENDKMAPIQVQNKQKSSIFSNSSTANSGTGANESMQEKSENNPPKKESVSYKVFLGETPVCTLCKRKFNDEYSIRLHEKFSRLHKDNLEKVSSGRCPT